MRRGVREVFVGCQQREVVTNAKLRDQSVDRPYLNTDPPTPIVEVGGVDVILPIAGKYRKGRKAVDDFPSRTRTGKSLEQLLQDDAVRYDDLATYQRLTQRLHFGPGCDVVTAKRQGPNTGIDEEGHWRLRSVL